MRKTQQEINTFLSENKVSQSFPGNFNINFRLLKKLVREETKEFMQAMDRLRKPESHDDVMELAANVIDAIIDIIWVVHNTAYAMNIDLEPFFEEVYRSNMTKVGAEKDEDGKVLKPETYESPELRTILLSQILSACNDYDDELNQ